MLTMFKKRKCLLIIFCITFSISTFAQRDKSRTVKTKFLQLPHYDIQKHDATTFNAQFASKSGTLGKAKLKDTKTWCKPRGGKLKDAVEVTTYYYEMPFTTPAAYLVVKDNNDKVIYARQISEGEKTERTFGYNKCRYWVAETVKKDWKKKQDEFEKSVNAGMANNYYKQAKREVKQNLLVTYINEEFDVFSGKGRSYEYDNLDEAFDLARTAYKNIAKKGPNKDAFEKLRSALTIWEKAIEEKNLEERRAKINRRILKGLYENCANAHMYLYDMDKALEYARKADKISKEQGLTSNRTRAWEDRIEQLRFRRKGVEINRASLDDLEFLNEQAGIAGSKALDVKRTKPSQFSGIKKQYDSYIDKIYAAQRKERKKRYREAVTSGEVNPYEKYVKETTTQGKMIMFTQAFTSPEFTEIPKKMCEIDELKQMIIMNNKIASIPPDIGKLSSLTKLDLRGNKIKDIPKKIGQLKNLKTLNLSKNPITEIPDEIKNCKSLQKLIIKKTDLSSQQIQKLEKLLPDTKIKS